MINISRGQIIQCFVIAVIVIMINKQIDLIRQFIQAVKFSSKRICFVAGAKWYRQAEPHRKRTTQKEGVKFTYNLRSDPT